MQVAERELGSYVNPYRGIFTPFDL